MHQVIRGMDAAIKVLAVLLLLAVTVVRHAAAQNSFAIPPEITEQSVLAVFFTFKASEANGRLWSIITLPSPLLTSEQVRAGKGKLGPSTCAKLNMAIDNRADTFGLTGCGIAVSTPYTLHVYIEADGVAGVGSLFQTDFTIIADPVPLPNGPFCFDVDVDYKGATVDAVYNEVADAEACQALCLASAACKHFRYVYLALLGTTNHRDCSLLSTDPPTGFSSESEGLIMGPQSCSTRSVNSFRPAASAVNVVPVPAVRNVPFSILVSGQNFNPDYDRILLVPTDFECGSVGTYQFDETTPGSLSAWASLECNEQNPQSKVSLLVCGRPPETVLVAGLVGTVKICLCDAHFTPFGCDNKGGKIEFFDIEPVDALIDVVGPHPNFLRYCPAGVPCTIEGIEGHLIAAGDKIMLRENCSATPRPAVAAWTDASLPSPAGKRGSIYEFPDGNFAVCPDNHTSGPCQTSRICYCAAHSSAYDCKEDGDFLTDIGFMVFFGVPAAPLEPIVIQEDHHSFTIRWEYPPEDYGGQVNSYTLYYRACPDGNLESGPTTTVSVPIAVGDNQWGLARNGTHQFRSVLFGLYYVDVTAATRYCVSVSATNNAGEGKRSPELVWVTDVEPPRDLDYPTAPLYLIQERAITPIAPTVTTADCRSSPLFELAQTRWRAADCDVQLFEITPSMPPGLSFDPASGNITGTPLEIKPRPTIYMVTATNAGGKSSCFLTLGVIGHIAEPRVDCCLSTQTTNDWIITFKLASLNGPDYDSYRQYPQTLRMTVLDIYTSVILQTSMVTLGLVHQADSVPCGQVILDTWSSSPSGFPPPTLCHWDGSAPNPRIDISFQGGATFAAEETYQLVVKMRVSEGSRAGRDILRLELFAGESTSDETDADSELFGAWTPTTKIVRWRKELSTVPPVPASTPLTNTPWHNGEPYYLEGYKNPLVGDAEYGYDFPWGFPAPMTNNCTHSTSNCPTSPHLFANSPSGTAWYSDIDPDFGQFPGFAIAVGIAVLQNDILDTMPFDPLGDLLVNAMPRPEVAMGTKQTVYVSQQEFELSFRLSTATDMTITLERDVTICPSSPLQWPPMSSKPKCEISVGPQYTTCYCESIFPSDHVAARCDRIRFNVLDEIEIRAKLAATLKISSNMQTFAGFLPVKWYCQVKSKTGGVFDFKRTENAGLDVAPDAILEGKSVDDCAKECFSRLKPLDDSIAPCYSFRYHKQDRDCYLTRYSSESATLKEDWPGNPYDNYEYQPQQAYTALTPEYLFYPGLYLATANIELDTYLDPPMMAQPIFDVPHFVPSYVNQPHLVFSIRLISAIPILGQSPWKSRIRFLPPSGFRAISLQAYPDAIPTPLGLGYCGTNYTCGWYLSFGQVLWPDAEYRFQLTLHNPGVRYKEKQLWSIDVLSAGLDAEMEPEPSLPVEMIHPLPVEGWLQQCSVHFYPMKAILPTGRHASATEDVLDMFFVLSHPWISGTTLYVTFPETLELTLDAQAIPLTPWLSPEHMSYIRMGSRQAGIIFSAPLQADAAIGIRLVPFFLPDSFDKVHPGFRVWPPVHDTIQPVSMSIKLRSEQPGQGAADDACHPALWSCGLQPVGLPALNLAMRPSRYDFKYVQASMEHSDPFRKRASWVLIEFALSTAVTLSGTARDLLLVTPPYGYLIRSLLDANLHVLYRTVYSGQLNLQETILMSKLNELAPWSVLVNGSMDAEDGTAAKEARVGVALRVPHVIGELSKSMRYSIKLEVTFPDSGVEPSLLDPTSRNPGKGGCANAWGVSLESQGEQLFTAFVHAQPLAFLSQFSVDCASRAFGADNLFTLNFATTGRALPSLAPSGTALLLVFTIPALFELSNPAVAADFAQQSEYNESVRPPVFGALHPEKQLFSKLGCPQFESRSRGQVLEAKLKECAVFFNDGLDTIELALIVHELPAAASHQVRLQVRNPSGPPSTHNAHRSSDFSLSIFRTAADTLFTQIPIPFEKDNRGVLLRLQDPLHASVCAPLLPIMQAEVHASACTIDGKSTEVTIGFIAPTVMKEPVKGSIVAPPGYALPWTCNFQAEALSLPGNRKFEYIEALQFTECVVSSDSRVANFTIMKTLKAIFVWNYFTIHVTNPTAADAPSLDQGAWALEIGDHASGSQGVIGVPSPRLRVFMDLELRELPYTYSSTSWALLLQMRTISTVPPGGYVVVHAPPPFYFPAAQCRGEKANYTEPVGSSSFVPAMRDSPFRPLLDLRAEVQVSPDLTPVPTRAACEAIYDRDDEGTGGLLVINVLEGEIPPGVYELRFAVKVNSLADVDVLQEHAEESKYAPMRWAVESWKPAIPCSGDCCPRVRSNFNAVVGALDLDLLDRGYIEAYPSGSFRHRRVVKSDYGGWRFSNDPVGT